MQTLRVGLECAGLAALIWAALFVIGWPVWSSLTGRLPRLSATTGAPLTGLAVVQLVGWYWNGHFALDSLSYGLVAMGAFASAVLAVRRRVWQRFDRANVIRLGPPFLALVGGASALFALDHRNVFRLGRLSTGILQQEDLPNYVLWSDHLRTSTLADPGNYVGLHLGHAAANTTPGTFVLMGVGATWTGHPTWEASMPLALLSVVLIACAARDLAKIVLPGHRSAAALVGLAAVSGSLFVYAVGFYPLSQLLGTAGALTASAVLCRVARGTTRRGALRGSLETAPAVLVLVMSYPHMAVLGAPIVVGVALCGVWGPGWQRRATRTVGTAAIATALCLAVVPSRVFHTVEYVRRLGNAQGGPFPFPLLTPTGMLGLQDEFSARTVTSHALFAMQAIVMVALLAAAILWTRRRARWRPMVAAGAVLATFASYVVVYVARGSSYTAWKWAAFFVPLFVAGGLAALVGLLVSLWPPRLARGVILAVLVLVVAGQAVAAFAATDDYDSLLTGVPGRKGWILVDGQLATVGDGPAWNGVSEVVVDVPSLWESTWSAYFVAPRRVLMTGAGNPALTEHSPAVPDRRWRLVNAHEPDVAPPRAETRRINKTYLLTREPTGGYRAGEQWVVGACAGVYRFDGRRWRAVARSSATGSFALSVTPATQPVGTRAPLLVRLSRAHGGRDTLLLEYLPHGKGRLLFEHRLLGTGTTQKSAAFSMPPGTAFDLDAIMDPLTGELRASVDRRLLLGAHVHYFRPRHGTTEVGSNPFGLFADALEQFPGTIVARPQARPQCDAPQLSTP